VRSSTPATREGEATGRVFLLRNDPDGERGPRRPCARPRARSSWRVPARCRSGGALARASTARPHRPFRKANRGPPDRCNARGERRSSRPARARVLERPSAASPRGRAEYAIVLGEGQVDPGAVAQRRRQRLLRLPGLRVGLRLPPGRRTAARNRLTAVVRTTRCRIRRARRSTSADEETGSCGVRPRSPIREESGIYTAAHGQGYSRFQRLAHGQSPSTWCSLRAPRRPPRSSLAAQARQPLGRARRLSVTSYVEWVLGVRAGAPQPPSRFTEIDPGTGALLRGTSWSGELLHRNRLHRPAAAAAGTGMGTRQAGELDRRSDRVPRRKRKRSSGRRRCGPRDRLGGRIGAGLDPCGAVQVSFDLADGASTEVVFLLGQGRVHGEEGEEPGRALPQRRPRRRAPLGHQRLGLDPRGARVSTPDRGRLATSWSTAGSSTRRSPAGSGRARPSNQSSGAFGFRDQLQDVMALAVSSPRSRREQPPPGGFPAVHRGRRPALVAPALGARSADPDLRQPPLACRSRVPLTTSGDGRPPRSRSTRGPSSDGPGASSRPQTDLYSRPRIRRPVRLGSSSTARPRPSTAGLEVGAAPAGPLVGWVTGNDGMNRGGSDTLGPGESVLARLVPSRRARDQLAPLAEHRGGRGPCLVLGAATGRRSGEALEASGLGRADSGTAAATSTTAPRSARREQRSAGIDSIAQSWPRLSGVAEPGEPRRAMAAVEEHLVRKGRRARCVSSPAVRLPVRSTRLHQGLPAGVVRRERRPVHATPRSGTRSAFSAELGDGDRAAEYPSRPPLKTPSVHNQPRAPTSHRYKVEPYVGRRDVYSEPPYAGPAAAGPVHGLGRAGCTARRSEWLPRLRRARPEASAFEPCNSED